MQERILRYVGFRVLAFGALQQVVLSAPQGPLYYMHKEDSWDKHTGSMFQHYRNKYPMHGCRIGAKCPILHAE
jgi:hypothetical protein